MFWFSSLQPLFYPFSPLQFRYVVSSVTITDSYKHFCLEDSHLGKKELHHSVSDTSLSDVLPDREIHPTDYTPLLNNTTS